MSYTKTVWQERIVATANKFLKTGETSSEVTLTNDPGTVTQAGTPFSTTAMNNLEDGVEANDTAITALDSRVEQNEDDITDITPIKLTQVADYGETGDNTPSYTFSQGRFYLLVYRSTSSTSFQRTTMFYYTPALGGSAVTTFRHTYSDGNDLDISYSTNQFSGTQRYINRIYRVGD